MEGFTKLSGLAKAPFEAIANALSEVPRLLNHKGYRIAVTGLQRSGKTVFVTSLVHALLHAADAPQEDFPFFPWRDGAKGATRHDISGVPRFPYRERLEDLLSESPKWPAPTTGLSGIRVRIKHAPTG